MHETCRGTRSSHYTRLRTWDRAPAYSVGTIHITIKVNIVELIVNNRTAMTIFAHPTDANATGVMLFGVPATVMASVEGWALTSIDDGDS